MNIENPEPVTGILKRTALKKIAFAIVMGAITTGIITFSLTAVNRGFKPDFVAIWLRSWITAYLIIIPCLLLIAPKVQLLVNNLFNNPKK
jgi:Mn2+/Fe2+ NRAMP family transporter